MSYRVGVPGIRSTTRVRPERSAAHNWNLVLSFALVNQTSLPEGAQLTCTIADCRGDSARLRPEVSTITIVPALSPNVGCSANATQSPSGDTRTLVSQPLAA